MRLKCWPTYTPPRVGLLPDSFPLRGATIPGSASGGPPGTAKCPEPLCLPRALPEQAWRPAPRRRTLLLLRRSYGLMRQTNSLPPPSVVPRLAGLCRLLPAPAGRWPFPTLSLRIFPWMLGPVPRWSERCTWPFLPSRLRPSPSSANGSATNNDLLQTTSCRSPFRGLSSFLAFRPPGLLATQVIPTVTDPVRKAAVALSSEQNVICYLLTHRTC